MVYSILSALLFVTSLLVIASIGVLPVTYMCGNSDTEERAEAYNVRL